MDYLESVFMRALGGQPLERTPIWLMRQAGRYLPEYRALRAESEMLQLCQEPELVAEVTLQPLRRFPLDAAILFSDITMPYFCMGVEFDIQAGVGPVVAEPIRSVEQINKIETLPVSERLECVGAAVKLLKRELKVPLIGFAGAPFTLATYLIEGKPSRTFKITREIIYKEPETWAALMEHLVPLTIDYLKLQIHSGVNAVQLFDSWVGVLPLALYERAVAPYLQQIFKALQSEKVPAIYFGTGLRHLFPAIKNFPCRVIGVDWSVPLDVVPHELGNDWIVQGNLDPVALFAPWQELKSAAEVVMQQGRRKQGSTMSHHIFNLGHGVLPGTPIDNVARLVDFVQQCQ